MKYQSIEKAVVQAGSVKVEDVIKAISDYIGSDQEDVRRVMARPIKLWETADALGKPFFSIWRNIATSQFEHYIVMKIAERERGIPVYFTYTADVFRGNNPEKSVFEKNKLFYGQGVNMSTEHLCFNIKSIEDRPLRKIATQSGLTLVEYHRRMRRRVGLPDENLIDLGDMFRELLELSPDKKIFAHEKDGRAKKEWYYPLWMMISSKLVVLEDFDVCKGEMKELVDSSYEKAISYGLNPNFVLLRATKAVDWYMTKSEKEGGVPDQVIFMIDGIR